MSKFCHNGNANFNKRTVNSLQNYLSSLVFVEMVTVVSSPRSPSAAGSADTPTQTDYLKIAKKGGGHKGKISLYERKLCNLR